MISARASRPDADLAGARAAHRRLLATLEGLDDPTGARPSRLPGWTVGHVLTHLARNADSHRRVVEAACRGEVADRYPGGPAQREGDIEAGAGRPMAEMVADVAATIAALEAAWAAAPDEVWAASGRTMGVPEPLAGLPFKRWREVEVHHVDLGLAFDVDDWSDGYVRRELVEATRKWRNTHAMGLTELPLGALALPPRLRLAWLIGRLHVPGLPEPPPWP